MDVAIAWEVLAAQQDNEWSYTPKHPDAHLLELFAKVRSINEQLRAERVLRPRGERVSLLNAMPNTLKQELVEWYKEQPLTPDVIPSKYIKEFLSTEIKGEKMVTE